MGRTGYRHRYIKHIGEFNTNHFTCKDCPAKLFNDDKPFDNIEEGIGNINSSIMIVYPTYVSVNPKLFDELTDIINNKYKETYHIGALLQLYITPVIKCYCPNANYNIKDTILSKCAIKTISEYIRHNCHTKIIFLGDSNEIEIYLPNNISIIEYIPCPCDIFNNEAQKEQFLNILFNKI